VIPQDVIPRCPVFVLLVAFPRITYLPASRSFSFSLTAPYGRGLFKPSLLSTWVGPCSILHSTPLPSPSPTVHHRLSRFLPVIPKSSCLTAGVPVLFLIPHHPLLLLCRIRGRYASITLIRLFHPHAHPHIRLTAIPHLPSTQEGPSTERFSVPLVVTPFLYPSRFCFSFPPYRRRTLS